MMVIWALPYAVQSPAMASPWLIWIGLGDRLPNSSDFVPVFPWLGFMLLGILAGRLINPARLAMPEPQARPLRWTGWMGRHSLPIYLIHQPVLYGTLFLIASVVVKQPEPEARPFLASCRSQCQTSGADAPTCQKLCSCAMETAKTEGLWASMLRDQLNDDQRRRVEAIGRRCSELSTLR